MPATLDCRPQWMRQRSLGKSGSRKMKTTRDLILRLKQEACLQGHHGCVNCLDWNQSGNLLASGSDDSTVIIWDAFKGTKMEHFWPGHEGIIFSVKFLTGSNDPIVATCGEDSTVRVSDITHKKTLLECKSCHRNRVKRLAVHPSEPHIFLSAGEDGFISHYDMREGHACSSERLNGLIDLSIYGYDYAAKCIAINPVRSEMIAVGSNSVYNRIFDRRYMQKQKQNSCIACFTPGHLKESNKRPNVVQSYGTTYLTFSSNGSELLSSVHAEQIYLYNVYEPWKSSGFFQDQHFSQMEDKREPLAQIKITSNMKPYAHLDALANQKPPLSYPGDDLIRPELFDEKWAAVNLKHSPTLLNKIIAHANELLTKINNCPDIYLARAVALSYRGWRGDSYQALRDCYAVLALRNLDSRAINFLGKVIIRVGDNLSLRYFLAFLDWCIQRYHKYEDLKYTREMVSFHYTSRTFGYDYGLPGLQSRLHAARLSSKSRHNEYLSTKKIADTYDYYDYSKRFTGHCNMNTDIKEANFFGANDEFIVGGSDDGALYIWDKETTNIVKAVHADYQILNCVQPHPNICLLATSGIESSIKLWSSSGQICRDVKALEMHLAQNNKYIATDPLEALINQLYPSNDESL